ncbi:HNH endonuclease [Ralstonia sp. CHL-2022]|uniref:HNH endonuclease n=1 Tax=Ralstonia mojiangensis TaxID=2953895 RepID=A0ABT2LCY3_9RALS|nr:HNH endonuclease [Ralstonia mojiangensis]MCT7313256.1 HNH endonuclease [Ralstonia mojiangensis]
MSTTAEPRSREVAMRVSENPFHPVETCIYCGKIGDKLNDEHIIPFALNGTVVLPNATFALSNKALRKNSR